MSIVTISRGSFSKGAQIAEKVASRLGYRCISRDVLLKASKDYGIPELMLTRAIHDAPSVLERLTGGKENYVAFIRSALLRELVGDDVVYHGLAGHFFVKDVSHVLKVRIIADLEDRVKVEMERGKVGREQAMTVITNDDAQRRKWSQHLYGIDHNDAHLYDLVVHIHKLSVDDAVQIVCDAAGLERFKTTEASRKAIRDLSLAAEVQASLVDMKTHMDVVADDGVVHLRSSGDRSRLPRDLEEVKRRALAVQGVREVLVDVLGPSEHTNPFHNI